MKGKEKQSKNSPPLSAIILLAAMFVFINTAAIAGFGIRVSPEEQTIAPGESTSFTLRTTGCG